MRKRKNWKRTVALVLSGAMVFSSASSAVLAEDLGGQISLEAVETDTLFAEIPDADVTAEGIAEESVEDVEETETEAPVSDEPGGETEVPAAEGDTQVIDVTGELQEETETEAPASGEPGGETETPAAGEDIQVVDVTEELQEETDTEVADEMKAAPNSLYQNLPEGDYSLVIEDAIENLQVGQSIQVTPSLTCSSSNEDGNPEETNLSQSENVAYCWEYNPEEVQITDADGKAVDCEWRDENTVLYSYQKFTVTKLKNYETYIRLNAQVKEEDGTIGDRLADCEWTLYEQDYDVWFDNLRESDWTYLYNDEDLEVIVDVTNLESVKDFGLSYKWTLGLYEYSDDDSMRTSDLSNCITKKDDSSVIISGAALYSALGGSPEAISNVLKENTGLEIRVSYYVGEEEITDTGTGVDFRLAEYNYSYPHEGVGADDTGLVGWDWWFGTRDVGCDLWDKDNPDGNFVNVEVTDIAVSDQYTWDEDGNTVKAENIVELSKGEDGWNIQAKNYGYAVIQITHESAKEGEGTITHELILTVSGDRYELILNYPNGTDWVLPGQTVTVETSLLHEWYYNDEERDSEYVADYSIVPADEGEGSWNLACLDYELSGNTVTYTVKRGYESWGAGILLTASVPGENGENIPVANANLYVNIIDNYYNLSPDTMSDTELMVGETVKVTPVVTNYFQVEDEDKEQDVSKEVKYRWEYDTNEVEILDANGNVVESEWNDENTTWYDYQEFTVRMLNDWGTNVNLIVGNEEGDELTRRDWYLNGDSNYSFSIVATDEGPNWYFLGENDTADLSLDTDLTEQEGVTYNVEWNLGIRNEENWPIEEKNALISDKTGLDGSFTFDVDELASKVGITEENPSGNLKDGEWLEVDVRLTATVKKADGSTVPVTLREEGWGFNINIPRFEMAGNPFGPLWGIIGTEDDMVQKDKKSGSIYADVYFLNTQYPYGHILRYEVTNVVSSDESVASAMLSGDGVVSLEALKEGEATITYTFTNSDVAEKYRTVEFSHTIQVKKVTYRMNVGLNSYELYPGQSTDISVYDVIKTAYDEESGETVTTELAEGDYQLCYYDYDESMISIDENGKVTANTNSDEGYASFTVALNVKGDDGKFTEVQTEELGVQVANSYTRVESNVFYVTPGESFKGSDLDVTVFEYSEEYPDGEPIESTVTVASIWNDGMLTLNDEDGTVTVAADALGDDSLRYTQIYVICRDENGNQVGDAWVTLTIHNHRWEDWKVVKEPTSTQPGQRERICEICGETETKTIPATGCSHVWKTVKVEPTCTTAGYTREECAICGSIRNEKTLAALGHTWGEWKVTKEATETEEGKKERTCAFCGAVDTEMIPATGKIDPADAGLRLDKDGIWRYYENGKFAESKSGIVSYSGEKFWVSEGILVKDANLFHEVNGTWYWMCQGRVVSEYTGAVYYDGYWFWVTNGAKDVSVTGLRPYDGKIFLFIEGQIRTDISTLYENSVNGDGEWYWLANGRVVDEYTGLVSYNGAWFYVKNGKLDWTYTGTTVYDGVLFKVKNGALVGAA